MPKIVANVLEGTANWRANFVVPKQRLVACMHSRMSQFADVWVYASCMEGQEPAGFELRFDASGG